MNGNNLYVVAACVPRVSNRVFQSFVETDDRADVSRLIAGKFSNQFKADVSQDEVQIISLAEMQEAYKSRIKDSRIVSVTIPDSDLDSVKGIACQAYFSLVSLAYRPTDDGGAVVVTQNCLVITSGMLGDRVMDAQPDIGSLELSQLSVIPTSSGVNRMGFLMGLAIDSKCPFIFHAAKTRKGSYLMVPKSRVAALVNGAPFKVVVK